MIIISKQNPMKTTIQSLHFTADAALNEFVIKKLGKLDRQNNQISSCDVCLKLEKSDTQTTKISEISLLVEGTKLFSKSQARTFESAVDESIDALQAQLRKMKSRKTDHDHQKL